MTLKHHLLQSYDPSTRQGVTACGEPFFRSLRVTYGGDGYEAGRRIGGLVAMDADTFFPDHHSCAKCRKIWTAL